MELDKDVLSPCSLKKLGLCGDPMRLPNICVRSSWANLFCFCLLAWTGEAKQSLSSGCSSSPSLLLSSLESSSSSSLKPGRRLSEPLNVLADLNMLLLKEDGPLCLENSVWALLKDGLFGKENVNLSVSESILDIEDVDIIEFNEEIDVALELSFSTRGFLDSKVLLTKGD
ncbi:hypothetical protein WICPIJ_008270 [Wickerhamomyces pijperi]|uniref:Uncharacterized protein n=1 Tax=Wickerhamomyces pijperi TaxID=599730 RepID=A0A9P8TI65_WICPI|nr:hypothetical protein WICPIJ_008270 [Wickerhamomyces pijperi]